MCSKDNWERMYFKICWKFWNWPSYSREYWLYWSHWQVFIEWVHLVSKSQSPHRSTTYHGCKDKLTLDTRVHWASPPITTIDLWVAPKSKIQWLPATLNNTELMDYCQVRHGSLMAILILDARDIKVAYGHIACCYHSPQWYVRLYGLRYVRLGYNEAWMEGLLVLRCAASVSEAVPIICWSDSNVGYASHFCTYPWSFQELAIVSEVRQGNEYQFRGWDSQYNLINRCLSELYWEWILCQTLTCTGQYTWKVT
jgi:hypothetical protein